MRLLISQSEEHIDVMGMTSGICRFVLGLAVLLSAGCVAPEDVDAGAATGMDSEAGSTGDWETSGVEIDVRNCRPTKIDTIPGHNAAPSGTSYSRAPPCPGKPPL